MKCISIRQPWASLIVSGMKTVENRSWTTNYRGPILIHASSYKPTAGDIVNLPLEWTNLILNAQQMGQLPRLDDMPRSAIIGYANLVDCVSGRMTDSIWDGGPEAVKFVLDDIRIFDTPILNVNGKLHIFDFPIDENNLPASHKVEQLLPSIEGEEFIMPITERDYAYIFDEDGNRLIINTTDKLESLLVKDDSNEFRQSFRSIRFVFPDGHSVRHKCEGCSCASLEDEEGKPLTQMSLFSPDPAQVIVIAFKVGKIL